MNPAFLFITVLAYEQLKARGGIIHFLSIGKRNLNAKGHPFVCEIHITILKHWLTMRMSNLSFWFEMGLKWLLRV